MELFQARRLVETEDNPIIKSNWRMRKSNQEIRLNEIYTLVVNHDVFNHSYNKIFEGYQIKNI
jgi:hypothetical protein